MVAPTCNSRTAEVEAAHQEHKAIFDYTQESQGLLVKRQTDWLNNDDNKIKFSLPEPAR